MSDGFLAKYRVADISEDEWDRRVAALRRTRSYQQEEEQTGENSDRIADLDDAGSPNTDTRPRG